jgi:hypothetical protein
VQPSTPLPPETTTCRFLSTGSRIRGNVFRVVFQIRVKRQQVCACGFFVAGRHQDRQRAERTDRRDAPSGVELCYSRWGPLMFCRSRERLRRSTCSRLLWQAFRLSSRQRPPWGDLVEATNGCRRLRGADALSTWGPSRKFTPDTYFTINLPSLIAHSNGYVHSVVMASVLSYIVPERAF